MTAIKLLDAETKLGYMLKDISDVPTATMLYFHQTISDYIYHKVIKTDPNRYISEQTYTLAAGTNDLSLPSDFMNIQPIDTGLFVKNSDGYETNKRFTKTEFGSPRQGYYIEQGNMVLTPDPNVATDSVVLRYIPTPPVYTANTEYYTDDKLITGKEIVPVEYMSYVVAALKQIYMEWDESASEESLQDFRYMRILDDLLDNLRTTGGSFIMPDISLIY